MINFGGNTQALQFVLHVTWRHQPTCRGEAASTDTTILYAVLYNKRFKLVHMKPPLNGAECRYVAAGEKGRVVTPLAAVVTRHACTRHAS
jgi:hypothetical protein